MGIRHFMGWGWDFLDLLRFLNYKHAIPLQGRGADELWRLWNCRRFGLFVGGKAKTASMCRKKAGLGNAIDFFKRLEKRQCGCPQRPVYFFNRARRLQKLRSPDFRGKPPARGGWAARDRGQTRAVLWHSPGRSIQTRVSAREWTSSFKEHTRVSG